MPEPRHILNYAGPRKRSKYRVESKCLLQSWWEDDTLVIVERRNGRDVAIAQMIASVVMLAFLVQAMVQQWAYGHSSTVVTLILIVFGAWLMLLPVVIQQTWWKTELEIGGKWIRLTIGGPLRKRVYTKRFDQVETIRVVPSQMRDDAPLLAAIEIVAEGLPPTWLFIDHPVARLESLAEMIGLAVRL